MAKKKLSEQPTARSPGFFREEIGAGITKRTRERFIGPLNAEEAAHLISTLDLVAAAAARDPFADVEAELREFLREAGLPDDSTEGGKYPHRSHITPELAECAYQSGTWYAAAILDQLAARKWSLEVGDARGAERAACEAVALHNEIIFKVQHEPDILAHDRSRQGAAKAGSKPKRHPAIKSFILARLRKDPSLKPRDLEESIPRDEFAAVPVGKKAKLFRDLGRIIVLEKRTEVVSEEFGIEKKGMVWKRGNDISPRSFRDCVAEARKTLKR